MNRNLTQQSTLSNNNGLHNSRTENGLRRDVNKNSIDRSSVYVHHRIFGYSVGAIIHLLNIAYMAWALRGPLMKDPDIELFYSMEFFYVTIWNLVFQLFYIAMGIACDLPVLQSQSHNLDWLRWYRKTFYSGILWPIGLSIVLIYWPIYTYDRDLIFPAYIDKVLSQRSNYIMHLFIAFPIVWDLLFLPNEKPTSQKYTLAHYVGVSVVYYIALFSLYGWRGVWPYPGLKHIYGTVFFPLVLMFVTILSHLIYFAQWPLISVIWSKKYLKMS